MGKAELPLSSKAKRNVISTQTCAGLLSAKNKNLTKTTKLVTT